MKAVKWDGVELLPKHTCCVCGKTIVPWGRTLDNRYLCSKRCCEAQSRK